MPINIRWAPTVTASDRHALEQRWSLALPEYKDGTTWLYWLYDYSPANIGAIVTDQSVLDTAHINRSSFLPDDPPERPREIRRIVLIFTGAGTIGLLALAPFMDVRRFWIVFLLISAAVYAASSLGFVPAGHPQALLSGLLLAALLGAIEYRVPLRQEALAAAIATAPLIFVIASVGILVMALAGYDPMWTSGSDLTLVEAAYHTDRAMVTRLIDRGADPNVAGPVTDEGRRMEMTPLEAAIVAHDLELVQILVSRGAIVDASNRQGLACLASEAGNDAIVRYIQGTRDSRNLECSGATGPTH